MSATTRAGACSDAIHKALFPRADAIHRMENSRRIIAEIVGQHFPEPPPAPPTAAITQAMRVAGIESSAWGELSDAVLKKGGWPYTCKESADCLERIYIAMRAKEPDSKDLLGIIDCGTNALIDSINCSGNDAVTNKHWVRKMRRDAGLDHAPPAPHPTSDPTHVAD